MGGWAFLVAGGVFAGPALAAGPDAASPCRFQVTAIGKVAEVRDGRSFVLADGREVRLAGLEIPPPPAQTDSATGSAAGLAARRALESIVAGQTVELRQQDAAVDRYGRTVAHAYLIGDGVGRSVAQEMLVNGYARASGLVGDKACAAELLAGEQVARAAKLGLWGDPYYAIRAAESGAELLAERGRFSLVEGRIVSVRESGGTIYVNFGRRWSDALTVTILKRHERIFLAAGVEPKRLANRRVRVRGWIEERNGPWIEATRPEQIELTERD
jgi:endonuclease YncB( thermonuclease family)